MRTTITLADDVLAEVKRLAVDSGTSMSKVVEDALRESLARRREAPLRPRVELPTDGSGGLQPGVDLDDNAALLDLMERDDRPL
jgi:hypothetical protein